MLNPAIRTDSKRTPVSTIDANSSRARVRFCPVPLRALRSTHAARALPATGVLASTRSIRMPRSWWNMPAR